MMTARLAQTEDAGPVGVQPDAVRIGKDVIELLTSGMYVFPVTIYREYVQNAVDAIDVARAHGLIGSTERGGVAIDIDHTHRTVSIRDNGFGLPSSEAVDILLAIGGSPKRGTGARGFRGVGRLSGLAYCRVGISQFIIVNTAVAGAIRYLANFFSKFQILQSELDKCLVMSFGFFIHNLAQPIFDTFLKLCPGDIIDRQFGRLSALRHGPPPKTARSGMVLYSGNPR